MSRRGRRRVAGLPADLATIARDVGALLAMEAALMVASVVVAVVFAEWHVAVAFLASGAVTAAVGLGARQIGRAHV